MLHQSKFLKYLSNPDGFCATEMNKKLARNAMLANVKMLRIHLSAANIFPNQLLA